MNRLIRFYNQNRKGFVIIILVIIGVILVLQVLNRITINNRKQAKTVNTNIHSETQKQYEAISGEKKEDSIYQFQTNVIEEFLNKCNDNDTEGAYNLLSEQCKTVLYPSINNFIDGYYNKYFLDKQSYSYQVWSGNTYQIRLRQDVLSTGMYSNSAYTEDYYTVVGNKLNIDRYIKRVEINKENSNKNLTVRIKSIDYYQDYTICNLRVLNKTNDNMFLAGDGENNQVILEDKNDVKYKSLISEMNDDELKIIKNENKDISIKFNCSYRKSLRLEKVILENILFNDETVEKDTLKVVVDL